ncbi:thiol reductant ABC exporter subunit CydD [Luteibacter sp. UNCMF366Tsu5.1]|uniref:thiol reductant ABC exporter subunit CydD n=1 Tax=Luteibacter sp. UNCMF366Tsu5.1 TaxID=1502758 RepID=UPI000908893A|nr:thiol reductant ABC exporter subunit CydD [Luteibacter sp. UNCMF366Tsu5.1]SFW23633.1 ATP-binding cassette, subfamily C, CydD [Luteibacter sp. UNCMF366Tsu5.1]
MASTEHAVANDWLRQQAQPVRGLLRAAIGYGATQSLLLCAMAWLVAQVLALAIFEHVGLADLRWSILAIAAIAILRAVLLYRQRMCSDAAGRAVTQNVQRALRQRLRELGPAWSARQSAGDLVTRLVDGVDTLAPYYAGYLPQAALAGLIPMVVLLAVGLREPWSALVLLLCAPLLPVFLILAGRAAADASTRRWLRLRRLGARFMDAVAGLSTLRLYRAAEREHERVLAAGEAYRQDTMAVLRVAFLSALVMEFFATCSIAIVAVVVGFRLMSGHLAFAPGMFALLLAPEFFLPLRAMGTQRHARMEAAAAAEGLVEVLAVPVAPTVSGPVCVAFETSAPSVTLRNVHANQGDHADVLRGIDLVVPAGTRLTLVGPSGGGKSSLLAAVMGLLPLESGSIEIDGLTLTAPDWDAWRTQVGWLPQRPHVFNGSLRDNLLLARPEADEVSLARVLRMAGLDQVVAKLPQGLDTPLGERGLGLSGGELQRLAIARMCLRDAAVLLWDEPTQHLDAATAAQVEQQLDQFARGRTVLRVAHRVRDLGPLETVAVLVDGKIVEQGTVAQLRQPGTAFSALLNEDLRA